LYYLFKNVKLEEFVLVGNNKDVIEIFKDKNKFMTNLHANHMIHPQSRWHLCVIL